MKRKKKTKKKKSTYNTKLKKAVDKSFNQFMINQLEQQKWEENYGRVKRVISAKHDADRITAVGSKLIGTSEQETFHDFLRANTVTLFSNTWFQNQFSKNLANQHPIAYWYNATYNEQEKIPPNKDGLIELIPIGKVAAFMSLSYDLYTIEHNHKLQKRIIDRLKNPDQFPGARYELFAAATCVRIGLKIDFEDESDPDQKHVEFIVTSNLTGEKFAVEAKSKFRGNVDSINSDITNIKVGKLSRLINTGLEKNPGLPLIIFVDVNLPPRQASKIIGGEDSFKTLVKHTKTLKKDENGKDIFNIIVFTNHPHHYGRNEEPDPEKHSAMCISPIPKYPIRDDVIIDELFKAVSLYGKIPKDFS